LAQRILSIRERELGPEHPNVAEACSDLGELYRSKGDYTQAEPLHQRALGVWEKAPGIEPRKVGTGLNRIGLLYYDKGDYDKAELFYQRARWPFGRGSWARNIRTRPRCSITLERFTWR
jgi:tetratricopeptide (TPR) repeat protein